MKAAHRRWHPRIWIVVGLVAVIGLWLGVAFRAESVIGVDAERMKAQP